MLSIKNKKIAKEWKDHSKDRITCTRCPLHCHSKNVVLCRGSLPCQVLFIGEAPGRDEDSCGEPFVGISGELLNTAIEAVISTQTEFTYAITNTVGCIPLDVTENDSGRLITSKLRQPRPNEMDICKPRLVDIIRIASPQKIVCLGEVALKNLRSMIEGTIYWDVTRLRHPSYVLRNGGVRSQEYYTFIEGLENVVKGLQT